MPLIRVSGSYRSLVGQALAVLVITLLVAFMASTLLYERQAEFAVRDDEARRLAEHLVVSRRVLEESPAAHRPDLAGQLTTDRYVVGWSPRPSAASSAPSLAYIRGQMIAWEPELADVGLQLGPAERAGVIAGSVGLADGSRFAFRTREPVSNVNAGWRRILLALIPTAALALLGGLLLRQVLLPLRRLAAAADRVGRDASVTVDEDGPGEVRQVITAFNRMQARIRRLIDDRTHTLAAVGHDLRTPLARLRLRGDAIADGEGREALTRDIDEMDAMIASLLAYLRGGEEEAPQRFDLAVMCATLVDDALDRGHVALYHGPEHCDWTGRRVALKRALANLVDNALRYGRWLRVTLESHDGGVTVRVEDDGPGIPDDRLAAAIEPFVRLDAARRRDSGGFGLGLAIVARVIEAEGGRFSLFNRPEGGLAAEVVLRR